MRDHLVKAVAEGVRVYAAVTTDLVNEGIARHDCYPVAAAALGRTMTGALLFAANLKNKEAVTLKFSGDGPLGTVTADATPEGAVRGYVGNPHVNLPLNEHGKLDVGSAVGRGLLSVTRFTGLKEPITGSCEITDGEIANDLTRYLFLSEQTPSSVGLGVLVGRDFKAEAAGGFFIQPLPDAAEETLRQLEENLGKVSSVSHMVREGMDGKEMIRQLLKGIPSVGFLAAVGLSFRCQCSRRRIEEVLLSLGRRELESLAKDGQAEVCCHFCGEKYRFSGEELTALILRSAEDPVGKGGGDEKADDGPLKENQEELDKVHGDL